MRRPKANDVCEMWSREYSILSLVNPFDSKIYFSQLVGHRGKKLVTPKLWNCPL